MRILTFRSRTLSVRILAELETVLAEAASCAGALVLAAEDRPIFLAGADLRDIAGLDERSCGEYALRGRRTLSRLARHPGPTVAAVDGACAGGALDLVTTCDAVVAGRAARFGHPGVRRGLVTGWGGTAHLAARLRPATLGTVVTSGALLNADEACRAGLVQSVSDRPLPAALAEARRIAAVGRDRLRLWRELRSGRFIDRFAATVVHNMVEANAMTNREHT